MINRIKNLGSALLLAATVSSCAVSYPFMLTNNKIGDKVGKSSTICLFSGGTQVQAPMPIMGYGKSVYNGLMLNKDFGIPEAVKKGKISKVATIDIRYDWYVFFTKKTFIVTGE
jgi:hypothetical protein